MLFVKEHTYKLTITNCLKLMTYSNLLILLFLHPLNLLSQKIKWKIPPVYDQANEFVDGYAVVQKSLSGHDWHMYGVIDENGKVILPFEYTWIIPAGNQTFWVSDSIHFNRKFKLVNHKNEVIFPFKYNSVVVLDAAHAVGYISVSDDQKILELTEKAKTNRHSSFMIEELVEPAESDPPTPPSYCVLLDRNVKEVTPPLYDSHYRKINDTIFLIINGYGQYTIFNLASSKVFFNNPCQGVSQSEGDKLVMNMDSFSYLVNYEGEVERKYHYRIVYSFRYGKAKAGVLTANSAQLNYKWGFIASNGDVVLPIEYQDVSDFDDETAFIATQNEYQVVDTAFHVLFSIHKDSIQYF